MRLTFAALLVALVLIPCAPRAQEVYEIPNGPEPVSEQNRPIVADAIGSLVNRVFEIEDRTWVAEGSQFYVFTSRPVAVRGGQGLCSVDQISAWVVPSGVPETERLQRAGRVEEYETRFQVVGPLASIGMEDVDPTTSDRCVALSTTREFFRISHLQPGARGASEATYIIALLQEVIAHARRVPAELSLTCPYVEGDCASVLASLSLGRIEDVLRDDPTGRCVRAGERTCIRFQVGAGEPRERGGFFVEVTTETRMESVGDGAPTTTNSTRDDNMSGIIARAVRRITSVEVQPYHAPVS